MPPVAITFHTPRYSSSSKLVAPRSSIHPSSASKSTIPNSRDISPNKTPTRAIFTITKPSPVDPVPILPSPPPSILSSFPSGPTPSKRRKSSPSTLRPAKAAHLTPLLQLIVSRCIASKHESKSETPPTISPPPNVKKPSHPLRKTKPAHITWPVIHPYSRLTDLGNNRSVVPSPKEIARVEGAIAVRVRAKKDGAAVARAKRKKAIGNGKRSTSGRPVTRSTSPVKQTEELPRIVTKPASAESTPLPIRTGLKRTRSQGLMPISTAMANGLGTGAVGVGSPLKAVMGPDGEDDKNAGRSRKRSRISDEAESLAPPRSDRRANTTSPVSNASPLPTIDPEIPHRTITVAELPPLPRSTPRSLSVAPTTGMRRAVSAGARGVGMGRTASAGAEVMGKERVKRETTIPGRLRDYVGTSGTVV